MVARITGSKVCTRCRVRKDEAEFYRTRGGTSFASRCKPCAHAVTRERYANNGTFRATRLATTTRWATSDAGREAKSAANVACHHSLPAKAIRAYRASHDGRCDVCGIEEAGKRIKRFVVDHDHRTGEIRGLLCHHCNLALGHARDSVAILQALIDYLQPARQQMAA